MRLIEHLIIHKKRRLGEAGISSCDLLTCVPVIAYIFSI